MFFHVDVFDFIFTFFDYIYIDYDYIYTVDTRL